MITTRRIKKAKKPTHPEKKKERDLLTKYIGSDLVERIDGFLLSISENHEHQSIVEAKEFIIDEMGVKVKSMLLTGSFLKRLLWYAEAKITVIGIEKDIMARLGDVVINVDPLNKIVTASLDSVQENDSYIKFTESLALYNDTLARLSEYKLEMEKVRGQLQAMVNVRASLIELYQHDTNSLEKLRADNKEAVKWTRAYIEKFSNVYSYLVYENNEMDVAETTGPLNSRQTEIFATLSRRATRYSGRVDMDPSTIDIALYVKSCPIVIHLPLDTVLEAMIANNDPFMRNQWETGSTMGSPNLLDRANWESLIFDGLYDDREDDSDRVKYGAIHLTYQRAGVVSLYMYGKSYLILRETVKERATITPKDSSEIKDEKAGTFRDCNHVTQYYSEEEKEYLTYKLSKLTRDDEDDVYNPFQTGSDYTEVQIHGNVSMASDVLKVMVDCKLEERPRFHVLFNRFEAKCGIELKYEFIREP